MAQYLHLFSTESAFTAAYNGNDYHEPWVSYTDETQGQEHVNYNKHGISSIPVYHGNEYAEIDIPVNGENGLSFSYTGEELEQWLDNFCQFRIAEEFVSSIEISADGWGGDYRYELNDGFYYLYNAGSGWRATTVTVNLNPSSNLADAKIYDTGYDAS